MAQSSDTEQQDYSDGLEDGRRLENLVQRRTEGLSTELVVDKFIQVGEILSGSALYPYQIPFARRVLWAILEREAEELSALFSRQSGKSQCLSFIGAVLMVMMPEMSRQLPDDDRFNFYDSRSGTYRSYTDGFWVGIFAPKREQATNIFNRIRNFLKRPKTVALLQELGITYETNNGDTFRLSNGSFVKCSTASDQANIEGSTLHLAFLEESQDISDEKANKSIGPMLAFTGGSLVKIGTANARKSHFYTTIRRNERRHSQGGTMNHFTVSWEEAAASNTFYDKFVRKEMIRLGETSDEFRMSYKNMFMLERGLGIPESLFINRTVTAGLCADVLSRRRQGMHYVAGIDFGKMHDSTVVTIGEVNWDNPRQSVTGTDNDGGVINVELYGKHVAAWLELLGDDYEAQYVAIKNWLQPWGVERICLDYTGVGVALGDRFKTMFDNVDIEFMTYSDDSKDVLCRELLADIHNGYLTWPGGTNCMERREYRNFRTQMLDIEKDYKNGLLTLHAPDIRGAHDDYCFPAGSLVETVDGQVPIEKVSVGTPVLTRYGWKRCTASGCTGEAEVITRFGITATANHPVYTVNRGWVTLDAITIDDTLMSCTRKPSSWTGSSSTGLLLPHADSTENTSGHTQDGRSLPYLSTDTCGRNTSVLSRPDTLFTTRTGTAAITPLRIWSAFLEGCTKAGTSLWRSLTQRAKLLDWQSSTLQRRGPRSMRLDLAQKDIGKLGSGGSPESPQCLSTRLCAKSAGLPLYGNRAGESLEFALRSAGVNYGLESTAPRQQPVNPPTGVVPVYNLSVEECPEFVCQGVLVHNCMSLAMMVRAAATKPFGGFVEESDNAFYGRG